jgi:CRP-like cAMP-binding protein
MAKTVTLSDEQFEHVCAHFEPLSFKKGQVLIAEGDPVDCEYFVVQGCLKTFHLTSELKMFILQFAMPTWWASDYQALYSGQRATVGVDCVTDVELLRLRADNREQICRDIHEVERFFRWRTNWGYVAAHKRLLSFMSNDVRQRYEQLLRQYPQLYQFVPKNLIAAYLGVSRETLSRLYQNRHEA